MTAQIPEKKLGQIQKEKDQKNFLNLFKANNAMNKQNRELFLS